ncbi:response regulator transcription factor [Variovorax fucosicus]|uniref:response regulator transcription factor n=1 Tax=Variovorax fucosicus TaxID=3053517 RepID=UPI00336533AF
MQKTLDWCGFGVFPVSMPGIDTNHAQWRSKPVTMAAHLTIVDIRPAREEPIVTRLSVDPSTTRPHCRLAGQQRNFMRIAALDDDIDQLDLTKSTLKAMGHHCHTFTNGAALLNELRRESFDLLLLDWELPDMSGLDIVRWVRSNVHDHVPILFVTNRRGERDVVEGLEVGADDFMSKPIRVSELTARVRALLRRAYFEPKAVEECWGRYRFLPAQTSLDVDGKPVPLTQKEFDLALFLFRNLGRLVSRRHLLEGMWKANNPLGSELMSRSLDTHVSRVRIALGLRPENGYRLCAVYGQGYRLEAVQNLETCEN